MKSRMLSYVLRAALCVTLAAAFSGCANLHPQPNGPGDCVGRSAGEDRAARDRARAGSGGAVLRLAPGAPRNARLAESGPGESGSGSEVLVVVGAFLALLAFAPSPETLGRWMSLKRKHHAPPAQFRRRRKS